MDYLYDGTFEGLLTCVYYNYYGERADGIYEESQYQQNMLHASKRIKTEPDKADKVYGAIGEKICTYDLGRTYKVYLSSASDKENIILKYLRVGFKYGSRTWQLHGDPPVCAFEKLAKKVGFEVHRLKGLVRFSMLENGVAFASITPDHDVLELLAHHFSDRFKNDPFIIFDRRRGKALLAGGGSWEISYPDETLLPSLMEGETEYRKMWKKYYDTIAISQRRNERCQKNFMPVRYWKDLTEKQLFTDM